MLTAEREKEIREVNEKEGPSIICNDLLAEIDRLRYLLDRYRSQLRETLPGIENFIKKRDQLITENNRLKDKLAAAERAHMILVDAIQNALCFILPEPVTKSLIEGIKTSSE